jgi:hypothetical protein
MDPSGLVVATLAGAVTPDDQRELTGFVRDAVRRFGEVGVLIRLEQYIGWHHDARFDPDGLWSGHDGEGISRVAIVGEPAWKIVAPLRPRDRRVPIEYFITETAARRWLEGRRAHARRPTEVRGAGPH